MPSGKMQPDDAHIFLVAGPSQSTLIGFDAKQA